MSGTQKKYLAIAGGIGVAAAMALLQTMPGNHTVHVVCETALTVFGLLGFTFPVSIKAPDAATPSLPESAVDKAASSK